MTGSQVDPLRPYGWCAVLAAATDDVLGTALAEAAARHRDRHPELVEVTHYRHRSAAETWGTPWFLFVAVVMGGGPWAGDLADTHPSLARDLWQACDLWTHSFPAFRRLAPDAPQLARYHRLAAPVVLPPPPPERPRPVVVATPKRVEAEAPATSKPAPAVTEQKGLFG